LPRLGFNRKDWRLHVSAKHDEIDAAPDVGPVFIDPAFEFAKARLTGEEPKLGENRKVTVKM
jgi:hypothetical protein